MTLDEGTAPARAQTRRSDWRERRLPRRRHLHRLCLPVAAPRSAVRTRRRAPAASARPPGPAPQHPPAVERRVLPVAIAGAT